MKLIIKLIIVFLFLGFLPISCENCDNQFLGKYKFDVERITAFDFDSYVPPYDSTTQILIDSNQYTIVNAKHYVFNLMLNISDQKIAQIERKYFSTTNSTFALSIRPCYNIKNYSIENKIDSIIIRSNSNFNTIPAGKKLNSLFTIHINNFNDKNTSNSVDGVVQYWNNNFDFYNVQKCGIENDTSSYCYLSNYFISCQLQLLQKPTDNTPHQFTIYLYKNNGEILQHTTKSIVWL